MNPICPKVHSAVALDDHTLLIEFENKVKKLYDVRPLLATEMFAPLRDHAFFRTVRVDRHGYAIVWNSNIDLSEYELWQHGTSFEG
ncbi:MAG: DUF2442 domain-containing protein [Chloracidobacterium sp.]|nr:DUF2442 domain-containing protein [Chloracidobacterium sp.]